MAERRREKNIRWKPIMSWGLQQIKALSYKPSTRWVFYRVMDRFGLEKDDWPSFKKTESRYRKEETDGWSADTLSDSSREIHWYGIGVSSFGSFVNQMLMFCPGVDVWHGLDFYVEAWFESEGMVGQFQHYLSYPHSITLRPFKGDYSIAKKLEAAHEIKYRIQDGKKVIILYFGDADEKGQSIPENALRNILPWAGNPSDSDFRFVVGGLTKQQALRLRLPKNPERPDEWQWDALSDELAQEIIETTLRENVDVNRLDLAIKEASDKKAKWKNKARRLLQGEKSGSRR